MLVQQPMLLTMLDSAASNRAPVGVFFALGVALIVVVIVLFFMIPVSGDDFKYGGFGGFGGYGGFGGI